MEETTDVKRKMTPSIPPNYVSILQLRERWIEEKERKQRKEQEEKDEERRRNQHAEEQQKIEEDPKKPREDWGGNSKKDDGGEARWSVEEETAAIGSERGEDEGLPEKKRGRRKRYNRKKKVTNQEGEVVEECGSIKPLEYTVKENNTPVKDQIRVYKKKEVKAMGNKSVEKAVTAIEDDPKHWGGNSKKDDGGEARWSVEEEETAAIGSEGGEDEGVPEKKKRGRRKRCHRKKKITNQEVEECGSIKPLEYTVSENNTQVKDQIRVYKKKEEKAVTAVETQFKDFSIQRGQETKTLKAQTRSLNRSPIETSAMVWVKKGENERAADGNGSGVKPSHA